MYGYNIIQWLFFFYFYCFFGWCFESTYVSAKSKKWINRGFMRGPFLPLYGSGGIMMLVVSAPFKENLLLTYLAGCVGATVLEYVTGVAMEKIFKVRYWDYSYKKFHFQGHICLSSSLAWGGLTIFMTHFAHHYVELAVFSISSEVLLILTGVITLIVAIDFTLSFKAALDLRDILAAMERVREELHRMQKRADVYIAVTNEELSEKVESINEHLLRHFNALTERKAAYIKFLRSYPKMTSIKFADSLEEIKSILLRSSSESANKDVKQED